LSDSDEGEETENLILCQYETVKRVKSRYKCSFKDGVAHVSGRGEYDDDDPSLRGEEEEEADAALAFGFAFCSLRSSAARAYRTFFAPRSRLPPNAAHDLFFLAC
jgi:hypothetical protein